MSSKWPSKSILSSQRANSELCLILSAALLFFFGILMVFNTTSAQIIDRFLDADTHIGLLKQIFYALIGVILGSCIYRWGHAAIIRWSVPFLIGASILLALVLIPGIGHTVNGSRRWLGFGGVFFQPAECIKILLPAAYIRWYVAQKHPIQAIGFFKILGALSIPIALILVEPDNGMTAILLSLLVVLFFVSRIKMVYWALPLILLSTLGAIGAYQLPYVKGRIQTYLHPELDLKGKGHQPHQAKIAAGSGQFLGRGLGESLQKLNYLPEARTDYIAAIFAEEFGFIGILGLIAVYVVFTFSGIAIAFNAQNMEGFLLASILTFLIAIQAFLNLGIVSGLLPSKGMTLPFFSQGGSSLIANIVALFILLDIAKTSRRRPDAL